MTVAHAADTYPSRPVRLLVPFAAGGGADTLARIIAPKLHDSLGTQWVVDNRGGAGGNIAAQIVAEAAPDGYTAFMGFNTVLTVNPTLYKLPYSVEKDFAPVTMLATASALSTATCFGSNEVLGPDIRSAVSHSPRIALANCSTVASRSPVPCKIRSGCSGTSYTWPRPVILGRLPAAALA